MTEPTPPSESQGDAPQEIFPDRRGDDRRQADRRRRSEPVERDRRSGQDRRQGERRTRNINQYDMTPDELEFANAVSRFRGRTSNRFPTVRDLLKILTELGYEKQT